MSQKPLGQIAHEAKLVIDLNAWMTPAWVDLPPPRQKAEEAAAQAIRDAVIEECGKHITRLHWERGTFPDRSAWTREEAWAAIALALESAAADLETLKSS